MAQGLHARSEQRPSSQRPSGEVSTALTAETVSLSRPAAVRPSHAAGERARETLCGIPGSERFDIREAIASGGQGTVFRACDRHKAQVVALKLFHRSNASARNSLKEEFRSLARLSHPGVVRLFDLYVGETHGFFTMEYLDGQNLDEYLHGDSRSSSADHPNWNTLRLVMSQLALALESVHSAGLLHLDLKPSNVRITTSRRVVLLDFGLARRAEDVLGRHFGGTRAYMAPEQREGRDVGEKTDWYAFGVMLYELLSGGLPPRADERHAPLDVRQLPAEVPVDLASLCRALLAPVPADRPTGRRVLSRLRALPPRSQRSYRPQALFVGRQEELQVLRAAHAAILSDALRRLSVIRISGPSGIGKSVLVCRFLEEVQRSSETRVFDGRCFERAMMPYRLLDELMDKLAAALHTTARRFTSDADIAMLCQLFPVFRQHAHPEVTHSPRSVGDELERTAIAVCHVLQDLALGHRALVLWLDDVHWSDRDSIPLLRHIAMHCASPLLLLVSGRPETSKPVFDALEQLSDACPLPLDLRLQGLSPAQVHDLIERLDQSQVHRREQISQQSAGSPIEVVEHVRHEASEELPDVGSTSLNQLYIGRLARLGLASRRLLEVAALAGRLVPKAWLLDASKDAAEEPNVNPLEVLQRAALVRVVNESVELSHDTIRTCVGSYLLPSERRQCHAALARLYEVHGPNEHEVLAYHLEEASELESCVHHLNQGADANAAALAFDQAAAMYKHAKELLDKLHAQAGFALSSPSGQSVATSPHQLDLRAIECQLLAGQFEEAEPKLRGLLRNLGLRTFESERSALLWGAIELARLFWRGIPGGEARAPASEVRAEQLKTCQAALRGYSTYATFRGAAYGAMFLRLARDHGEPWHIVLGSVHVASFLNFFSFGWAKSYARQLLDNARILARGDQEVLALIGTAGGTRDLFGGSWRAGFEQLYCDEHGIRSRGKFGPEWNLAAQMSLVAIDRLGEMGKLADLSERLLREANERNNNMTEVGSRVWLAVGELARDRVERAREELRLASERAPRLGYLYLRWAIMRAKVQLLLYTGESEAALGLVRSEQPELRNSGLTTLLFVRVATLKLNALALAAEARAGRVHAACAGKELRRIGRALARDKSLYAGAVAHLVRANSHFLQDEHELGVHHLSSASRCFEAADMKLHAAGVELCRALLCNDVRALEVQENAMHTLGVAAPRRWARHLCLGATIPST